MRLKQRKSNTLFEVAHGVNAFTVQPNFEVTVTAGRIAGAADKGYHLAALNGLSGRYEQLTAMRIHGNER